MARRFNQKMLVYFLQGVTLGTSAAASPGPYQAFVITQSLRSGWRRTLPAALAPLVTDGPIIALVLLILTRVPEGVLKAIQIVGGFFVLYLGWKSFQAYRQFRAEGMNIGQGSGKSLMQAILMNFLSPGPYLFWSLLAGPLLVQGWTDAPVRGLAFLGGFYGAMVGGMVVIIIVFSAARRLGAKVTRIMLGLSSIALTAFGIYQLWQGLFR